MTRRLSLWPAILSIALGGCLPSSCSRTESRSLFPEDSTSRAFAASLPVDTLTVLPAASLPEMEYPRTVAFGADGTLWASDTGDSQLLYSRPDGSSGAIRLDTLLYPYLVGFRGGHPVVFSPDAARLAAVGGSWSVSTPADLPVRTLQYAAVSDSTIWIKLAGADFDSRLMELDADGQMRRSITLPAPYWRWAGALRLRNGEPVSLSGYRPQVYHLEGETLDSTRLAGFDSPMLPRSRSFVLGGATQPPLLTPSGAFLGDWLYALNIRPGWLRVDVFGPDLTLDRILVEPDPAFGQEFYPTDIAVRQLEDGAVLIAVSVTEPTKEVRLYRAEAR